MRPPTCDGGPAIEHLLEDNPRRHEPTRLVGNVRFCNAAGRLAFESGGFNQWAIQYALTRLAERRRIRMSAMGANRRTDRLANVTVPDVSIAMRRKPDFKSHTQIGGCSRSQHIGLKCVTLIWPSNEEAGPIPFILEVGKEKHRDDDAEQSRQTGGYYANQWTVRDEYAAAALRWWQIKGIRTPQGGMADMLADTTRQQLANVRVLMPSGSPTRCWPNAGGALVRSWLTTSPKC